MEREDISNQIDDIKERMKIDENALHVECVEQPIFYSYVGRAHVEAKTEAKRAKYRVELKRSEVELAIRKDPEAFGLKKVSEASVFSAVNVQKEYLRAKEEMFQAEEDADSLYVLVEAAAQRKSMIGKLVDLYVSEYYSYNVARGGRSKMSESDEEKIVRLRREKRNKEKDE